MNKKDRKQAIRDLRDYLVYYTKGCNIQDGWPCGTCTIALLAELGVKEDGQHNRVADRGNEVWRAILQIREVQLKEKAREDRKKKLN